MADFRTILPTDGACSVAVHLVLRKVVVSKSAYDLWSLKSPNPRMAALKTLGLALQQVESYLDASSGKPNDAEGFEIAVSNLFSAAGFVTFNPGKKHAKSGETVDVVAIHPLAPLGFCIECTLGPANNRDKLGKLSLRVKQLKAALPKFAIKPILVVASEENSAYELTEASNYGTILLNKGHLRTLRMKIEWDAGPFAIAQWLLGGGGLPKNT
jgi:hypothetical protein